MPEIVQYNEKQLAEPVLARYNGAAKVTFTSELLQEVLEPGRIYTVSRRDQMGGPFDPATEAELAAQEAFDAAKAEEATSASTPVQEQNGSSAPAPVDAHPTADTGTGPEAIAAAEAKDN